jgi:hypothetical protein
MTASPNPYHGFRYPAEVIQYVVWLIATSACACAWWSCVQRHPELILAGRGVVVLDVVQF